MKDSSQHALESRADASITDSLGSFLCGVGDIRPTCTQFFQPRVKLSVGIFDSMSSSKFCVNDRHKDSIIVESLKMRNWTMMPAYLIFLP